MSDPNEEKNVEELLSQLQGIFGKLSQADEDESREKTDLPVPKPLVHATPPPVIHPVIPEAETAPPPAFVFTPPTPEPVPQVVQNNILDVASAPVMPAPEVPQTYDTSTIGCAIYYPLMREKEAKILAEKIETMTPKFTKLAFKLKVGFIVSYDPRSDWREAAIAKVRENNIRALFLLSDRVLDETKRRAMQTDLEAYLIYFQEVPMLSLEKKAFFTDVLLGMVFFFDTLKPKSPGE
jgi:hypothetical protein